MFSFITIYTDFISQLISYTVDNDGGTWLVAAVRKNTTAKTVLTWSHNVLFVCRNAYIGRGNWHLKILKKLNSSSDI